MRQDQYCNLFEPEFTSRVPSAIVEAERKFCSQGGNLIAESILAHPEAREVAEFTLMSVQPMPEPEDLRFIAGAMELGIVAGVQLASEVRQAEACAHKAGVFWKNGAAIALAACVALFFWDIGSDDLPVWQIIAALTLVAGIAGIVYRIGRDSAARALASLLTSGKELARDSRHRA
jgi:hypothetical protein